MAQTGQSPRIIRFGVFEVDLDGVELRKQGLRLRLQDQPFQILTALLEKPGEVVTREDLVRRLWSDGTVVDFDRGLNAAVTRLRQALSDSAETPRYVETVARRGYRFIAPLEAEAHPITEAVEIPIRPAPALPVVYRRSRTVPAFVSLTVVAVAAWWMLRNGQSTVPDGSYKAVPLTTERGFERHPSFSPDGSQIAFEWDEGTGQPHIFVKVAGPGDPVRLTSASTAEFGPAWSRDGRNIAFLRAVDVSMVALWVIPAVGGVERKVAEFASEHWVRRSQLRRLAWMPDSRHLVLSGAQHPGQTERLILVDTEGGEITWLTPPAGRHSFSDFEPAVSPDGRSIAFIRGTLAIIEELHLLSLSADMRPAGEVRNLVPGRRSRNPFWTPDGREILFVAGSHLSRIGLKRGAAPRDMLPMAANIFYPALSPTWRLAFSVDTRDSNVWRQELPTSTGIAPPQRLLGSTADDQDARYSPDGTRIVFQSTRSGKPEIWICGADGAHCLQLTNINRPFITGTPRWSPDGKWIAFDSAFEGRFHIYVVNAGGGSPRRLTTESTGGAIPSWSHDGKWIYYAYFSNAGSQIWKVPSAGGASLQVTRAGGHTAFESSDGDLLYYTKGETDPILWQSALDGSGEREVVRGVSHRGFVPVGDTIYYLRDESPTEISIRRFKISSHEDSRISSFTKPTYLGLSLSPDGRYLIYSQIDEQGADLMMVENFR